MHQLRTLSLLVALATTPLWAAEKKEHREQHAHQHGIAEINVAFEKGELTIALEGPAENILGFEHAPKTDAQKKTVTRAEQALKQPQQLFVLPPAARCEAQPPRVEIELPSAGSQEQHSEFQAEYRWRCAAPAELRSIEVGLFKTFPRLKELRAQVVTERGQTSTRLTAGASKLSISP